MATCYHGAVGACCRAAWIRTSSGFAVMVSLAGCGGPTVNGPIESHSRSAAKPATPVPPRVETWAPLKASEAWPSVAPRFLSEGHGQCSAEIRVSPAVRERYREWTAGARVPRGTVLIELCFHPGSGGLTAIYGMEKRADERWDYVVAKYDGSTQDYGDLPLCSRCHAEAVSDGIFGLPRLQPE